MIQAGPPLSRAWFVDRYGGPERLVLRERADPVSRPPARCS